MSRRLLIRIVQFRTRGGRPCHTTARSAGGLQRDGAMQRAPETVDEERRERQTGWRGPDASVVSGDGDAGFERRAEFGCRGPEGDYLGHAPGAPARSASPCWYQAAESVLVGFLVGSAIAR